jgi:membrane protein YqaA with SNARE-associated domain
VHFKRLDWIFVIIILILCVFSIYFEFDDTMATPFQISTYQAQLNTLENSLWIVFLVCLIGNISPIPFPYMVILWIVANQYGRAELSLALLMGLIASFGCLIGEIFTYWIGRLIQPTLSDSKQKNMQFLLTTFNQRPWFIPVVIYFFGATPISDDILLIPLGLIKYSPKKTILFCWFGKLTLMEAFALLPDLFGMTSTVYSFVSTMLPLFLIVIITYIVIRLDWVTTLGNSQLVKKWFKIPSE